MSDIRVKQHPTLGILVGTDGHVMVPAVHNRKAHWTYGTLHPSGYRQITIAGKQYRVHRLVVEAFIQYPIPDGYEVDHANRVRDDNRVENLRIVTKSENQRNTAQHDRVTEQGRTHRYEDEKQFNRELKAHYRAEHPEKEREAGARYRAKNKDKLRERRAHHYAENSEKVRERNAQYRQAKRKTHRCIHFADGSRHWLPLPEAEAYLIIPLKERNYAK